MLSLPRHILLLILWITLFFNIERLHINRTGLINIAPATYVLVAGLLVAGLILPQWRPRTGAILLLVGLLGFVASKLANGLPFWGDAFTFVTLFELTAVVISVALAYRVGQLTADFVETLRSLLLPDLEGRVHHPDQAEALLKRELQAARRRSYPLSILLLEADTNGAKIEPSATAQELQRLLARRVGQVTLTRLIANSLRPSDSIVQQVEQARWLLLTSEVRQSEAAAILHRLNEQTTRQLGIKLKYGIASYPDQGLTFEDLLAKAEQDLRSDQAERRRETPVEVPAD
ncbi:MAG: hypothetical protein HY782_27610 [Chloroflexi bacterium]|nr:hypothetical protein [Chloroflexota bacterium]